MGDVVRFELTDDEVQQESSEVQCLLVSGSCKMVLLWAHSEVSISCFFELLSSSSGTEDTGVFFPFYFSVLS